MPKLFPPAGRVHDDTWNADAAKRSREKYEAERKAKRQAIRNRPVVDYFGPDVDPQTLPKPYRGKR